MTALGKLLAFLNLAVGLALMTWAVNVYVQRPAWFNPAHEGGIDKGNNPVTFAALKTEIDSLGRAAGMASESWGKQLKELEASEELRRKRNAAYAERIVWSHKGNPNDLINPKNPDSGKGFYASVADPKTRLHDLELIAGVPKGKAIVGSDNQPLPGLDKLLESVSGDTEAIVKLNKDIILKRQEYGKVAAEVIVAKVKVIKLNEVRDSVQAELFFLSTFEVNVFETRETVVRREKQLRQRLRLLGVSEP